MGVKLGDKKCAITLSYFLLRTYYEHSSFKYSRYVYDCTNNWMDHLCISKKLYSKRCRINEVLPSSIWWAVLLKMANMTCKTFSVESLHIFFPGIYGKKILLPIYFCKNTRYFIVFENWNLEQKSPTFGNSI